MRPEDFDSADPIPKEQFEELMNIGNGFFSILDSQGNDKQSLIAAMSAITSDMQGIMLRQAETVSAEDSVRWACDITLLITMVKVVMNNPMFGTEALTLQMRSEFEQCLRIARSVELKE